jgi:fibronectin-binding autotransporter adhesin
MKQTCIGLLLLSFTLYFPFLTAAQCTWNSTNGNWSDAAKWSCGHVPLASDNTVISAGTVTLDVAPAVNDFTITGGALAGSNDITVNGNFSLSSAILGQNGDINVSGTFSWTGGTIGSSDGTATGTLNIAGATSITGSAKNLHKKTLNLNGGGSYTGNNQIVFRYLSIMTIPAGKTFTATATTSVSWSVSNGGGTINGGGVLDKQGSGALSILTAFNNTGSVQVNAGSINLSGGGTHSGVFSAVAATTLEFGGTHDLSSASLSGTGLLKISNGTATFPSNSTHSDVTVSGGTANFQGMNTMSDLNISSGTANFQGTLSLQNIGMTGGTIGGTAPMTVAGNLSISNGTLGNTGDVTVAGTFDWASGTIGSSDGTATGTVSIAGATSITSSSAKNLHKKTLSMNDGGSYAGNGQIIFRYSGILNIPAGKTFTANVTASVSWSISNGGGTINSAGTFDKQGSSALSILTAFNNTGSVQVNAGSLNLSGGGTHNGAFSIAATTTLEFGGGTHDLSTSTLSGTGLLKISGGTATFPSNSTHSDVTVSGGTANFQGMNTMSDLNISGGALNFQGTLSLQNIGMTGGTIGGTAPITVAGNLSISNGTLGNTGDVTVAGTFDWASGTIGSSDGTATGAVSIAGATSITSSAAKNLHKKTLSMNDGGSYAGNGQIIFRYSGILSMPAGKTFTTNVTASVSWSISNGGGTINSAGTFDKQGSSALSISTAFNNTGSVQVNAGSLTLSGGGTHNGAFSIAATTTLEFGGGTHDLSTSTLSGTGLLKISGGTATFPSNSTHSDVTVSGGTANFQGMNTMSDLNISSGALNFQGTLSLQNIGMTGGTIGGTAPITVAGNLSISNGTLGNAGDVTVAGTFDWSSGTIGSSDGTATGTVSIAGATSITSSAAKSLHKKTLSMNDGGNYTGNGQIIFRYSGILSIPAGKTFTANVTASVSWSISNGGGTINNIGTFEKQGTGSLTISATFDNTGVLAGSGTMVMNGTFNNNTGLISPGASPGVLNVNKTTPGITLTHLATELEGPNPGTGGYDQLNNTTGPLNLNNGTLTVTLLNSYLPNVGNSFTIATGTSRTGAFGTLNLPFGNSFWSVSYTATSVVLTVITVLPVELIDFQVNKIDKIVQLSWQTASEHNNRGFGIERSIDGRDYETIGFVESSGNSGTSAEYRFDDREPPLAAVIYYRLRQEDLDGEIAYSPVRSVVGTHQLWAELWPNPVGETAVLNLDLPAAAFITVSVADLQGRYIRHLYSGDLPKGVQNIPIPELDVPAGLYLLSLQTERGTQRVTLLKK